MLLANPLASNVRNRSREAANALRSFVEEGIRTHRLKPGDKLPPERDLSAQFGIGRNTVRRILVALEMEGKIVRHVGRGTFISPPAPTESDFAVARIARAASPLDLMELRISLEPSVAALCVQRASHDDINRMHAAVEASKTARTLQEFEDLDDILHRTIAHATRNPLFIAIAELITTVRADAEWGVLKKRTLTDELRGQHTVEHFAIVDAIRRRDVAAARDAMLEHLRAVQKMMFTAG